mgnify:CR=1 FL=1
MTIGKYREIVEPVEALELGPSPADLAEAIEFCAPHSDVKALHDPETGSHVLFVGDADLVTVGDWMIRGDGFLMVCSALEFVAQYEPIPA